MSTAKQEAKKNDMLTMSKEDAEKLYRHHTALATIYGSLLGFPEYVAKAQAKKDAKAEKQPSVYRWATKNRGF